MSQFINLKAVAEAEARKAELAEQGAINREREGRRYRWDRRFLEFARTVASWSKDPSTKVGAVIVRPDKTVVSTGYNGFPKQLPDDESIYADREQKYARVIHAEMNAILFAREQLKGYTIYCSAAPCERCTAHIIQTGINRIVTFVPSDDLLSRWAKSFELARTMCAQADVQLMFYPNE